MGRSSCVPVCGGEGQRSTLGFILWVVSTLVFEKLCLIGLQLITQSRLVAREPQGSACLCLLLVLRLQGCRIAPGLILWVPGIKFRPPYILLNEPSLQPERTFLYMQSILRIEDLVGIFLLLSHAFPAWEQFVAGVCLWLQTAGCSFSPGKPHTPGQKQSYFFCT